MNNVNPLQAQITQNNNPLHEVNNGEEQGVSLAKEQIEASNKIACNVLSKNSSWKWDINSCNKFIHLEGKCIFHIGKGYNACVLGDMPVSSYKVKQYFGKGTMLGFAPKPNSSNDTVNLKDGWYLYFRNGSLVSSECNMQPYINKKENEDIIKPGDVIGVFYKDKTISYSINNQDCGVAFSNVDGSKKLFPAVCFYEDSSAITILNRKPALNTMSEAVPCWQWDLNYCNLKVHVEGPKILHLGDSYDASVLGNVPDLLSYKVKYHSGYETMIGFAPKKILYQKKINNFSKNMFNFASCGWYMYMNNGSLYSYNSIKPRNYANKRIPDGAIIEAFYDKEGRTISFAIDGESYGVAFSNIVTSEEVFPAFCFYNRLAGVEILDGQKRKEQGEKSKRFHKRQRKKAKDLANDKKKQLNLTTTTSTIPTPTFKKTTISQNDNNVTLTQPLFCSQENFDKTPLEDPAWKNFDPKPSLNPNQTNQPILTLVSNDEKSLNLTTTTTTTTTPTATTTTTTFTNPANTKTITSLTDNDNLINSERFLKRTHSNKWTRKLLSDETSSPTTTTTTTITTNTTTEKDKDKIEKLQNTSTSRKSKMEKFKKTWDDFRKESKEQKEERKRQQRLSKHGHEFKAINNANDQASEHFCSFSESRANSVSQSSFSKTEESMTCASESHCDSKTYMKDFYHELYQILNKSEAKYLSQLKFNSSRRIRITLLKMKQHGFIQGRVELKGKIMVNCKGKNDITFGAHTTHGSANHKKWYHNPEIIVNFMTFIANCDPEVKEYLNHRFSENCFSRDNSDPRDNSDTVGNCSNFEDNV